MPSGATKPSGASRSAVALLTALSKSMQNTRAGIKEKAHEAFTRRIIAGREGHNVPVTKEISR